MQSKTKTKNVSYVTSLTGSTISGGSIAILASVAAAVTGIAAVLVIRKKKKKTVAADEQANDGENP